MVGMMLWEPSGHWTRPVTLKEVSVLHIRFLCARMAQDRRRNPLTERRRLRTAGKKLLRQRVEQVVLPAGASAEALPEGLRPVETLSLRRAIAADWCGELLRFRGENPAGARVLITADALSGEVVRTVTELALRHRYLILKVPFGGEELCRRLRREYGVSIVLNPETEREPASVHMAFDPAEAQGDGVPPEHDAPQGALSVLQGEIVVAGGVHLIVGDLAPDADAGQHGFVVQQELHQFVDLRDAENMPLHSYSLSSQGRSRADTASSAHRENALTRNKRNKPARRTSAREQTR